MNIFRQLDEAYEEERFLSEASRSRVYQHLMGEGTVAIISTYRPNREESENRKLLAQLKSEVRNLGCGFNELVSRWAEVDESGDVVSSDERALFIANIKREDALRLGAKYEQSSVIYKDESGCKEICTNSFKSYDGNEYDVGETVRTFTLNKDDKTLLNLKDAEEIFAKRKGGPASKLVKDGTAFHLSEVLECEPPRASYFQNHCTYIRIYKNDSLFEVSL